MAISYGVALLLSTAVANKASVTLSCRDRGTGVVHRHGKSRRQGAEEWRHCAHRHQPQKHPQHCQHNSWEFAWI